MVDSPRLVRFCTKPVHDMQVAAEDSAKFAHELDKLLVDDANPKNKLSTFFAEGHNAIEEALVYYFAYKTHTAVPKKVRYLLIDPVLLLRYRVPISPTEGEHCHPKILHKHFDIDLTDLNVRRCFISGTLQAHAAGAKTSGTTGHGAFKGVLPRQLSKKQWLEMMRRVLAENPSSTDLLPDWAQPHAKSGPEQTTPGVRFQI